MGKLDVLSHSKANSQAHCQHNSTHTTQTHTQHTAHNTHNTHNTHNAKHTTPTHNTQSKHSTQQSKLYLLSQDRAGAHHTVYTLFPFKGRRGGGDPPQGTLDVRFASAKRSV